MAETLGAIYNPLRTISFLTLFLVTLLYFAGCGSRESGKGGAGGRVTDSYGNALAGVLIYSPSDNEFTQSDDRGVFHLTQLSTGLQTLFAEKKFYATNRIQVEIGLEDYVGDIRFILEQSSETAEIFNVIISEISENSAVISYNTNVPALGNIEYGLSTNFDQISLKTATYATRQSITLNELRSGVTYYFRVKTVDEAGKTRLSSHFNFITKQSTLPVPPAGFRFLRPESFNTLSLAWSKVEFDGFHGYKLYRRDEDEEAFHLVREITQQENYKDLHLEAGKRYEYQIVSTTRDEKISSPTATIKSLVYGTIRGQVIWDEDHSPYELHGDIFVEPGATLTIKEGTEVILATDTTSVGGLDAEKIEFNIQGTLNAIGTADKPIIFRGSRSIGKAARADSWDGLKFYGNGSGKSSLKYVELSDFGAHGVRADGTTVTVENSLFKNGLNAIILANTQSNSAINGVIRSVVFKDLTGTAIIFDNLFDNEISNCRMDGDFVSVHALSLVNLKFVDNVIKTPGKTASMTVRTLEAVNNILEIPDALGLSVNGRDIVLRKNTIHAESGLTLYNHVSATVENNIICSLEKPGNVGVTFNLSAAVASSPVLMHNDLYNYTTNTINTIEGAGSTSIKPDFIGGVPFSYDLPITSPLRVMGIRGDRVGALQP